MSLFRSSWGRVPIPPRSLIAPPSEVQRPDKPTPRRGKPLPVSDENIDKSESYAPLPGMASPLPPQEEQKRLDVGPSIKIVTDGPGTSSVNIDAEASFSQGGRCSRLAIIFSHGTGKEGPLRLEMPVEHAREVARSIVGVLGLQETLADWTLDRVTQKPIGRLRRCLGRLRRRKES